ncbi:D-alanyl-D-alanine carboxypeptidase family protein [Azorhizobium doebereinerae]|uniref:D-alanyl-D-alanine carboxypeptidase family protein n=1 Tax=Azorhizobium doebereinerae TaxID=281091 RepID=UPI00041439DC|nr:D-alanyl-D-alanine carboxypeptidase family protein [Azorhizobium doebereinerae]
MPGLSSLSARLAAAVSPVRGAALRIALSATALVCVAGTSVSATPVLLVEADTGRVLEQQDAGKPWYPASVTKLMTVYVALNAVKEGRLTFDTLLTVSPLAANQQPSKMGFKAGTQLTLENALRMLMVKSANDMAVVIAEGVGGSVPAFAEEMNDTAARLGMHGTHYNNPNGLPDPEQYTTARDLAVLARALIYHFPEQEALFRIPAIKLGKAVIRNYNRLIDRYPGADGMKTGFICSSGFNLVATATRGNKRLIAVILGAPSAATRTEQAAMLFEKGFQPSWSIFGSAAPTLDNIADTGGEPTDMKAYICGGKRGQLLSENEDDAIFGSGGSATSYATQAAQAAGFSGKNPGAALLQTLPPSMPPIPVFLGPKGAPTPLETAYPEEEKKPVAAKPGDKKTKQAATTTGDVDKKLAPPTAAKPVSSSRPNATLTNAEKHGFQAKPVPAARPQPVPQSAAKPATTAAKPNTAAPKTAASKPAPSDSDAAPAPAARPGT